LRFSLPFRLTALALLTAIALAAPAAARERSRPPEPPSVGELRGLVDHYRTLTWTWQRAARYPTTRTSFSYRRRSDRGYLRWAVDVWTRRAYRARVQAVARLSDRLRVSLPADPGLRTRLGVRIAYSRTLALRLRRIYPGRVPHWFTTTHVDDVHARLRVWQRRGAHAALDVALHGAARPVLPQPLVQAFACIHGYEGAWNANTGNGYYGGLQMDLGFQQLYGRDYLRRWGTADRWPSWAQIAAAVRAFRAGRGFRPWPNSARVCGLL
jgi:hypothetical protein